MILDPTPGLAFIIEAKKEKTVKIGNIDLELPHKNDNVGAMGTIHAINPVSFCPDCQKSVDRTDLKVGDKVLYSQYAAEHVEIAEKGLGGRLFSVPIDSILAKCSDL